MSVDTALEAGQSSERRGGEFSAGWRVLAASSLGIAFGISPIPFNTIGHLVPGLQAEFGWSRAEIMLAISVIGITNAMLTPLFGILIDRVGVRRVAIVSLAAYPIFWIGVAFTPSSLLVFYSLWFLMALVGGASQPISWTRGVNAWFEQRRGLALGIALTGSGIAGFLVNALAPYFVDTMGWRSAVLATAALPIFIALPLAVIWFRDPASPRSPELPARTASSALQGVSFRTAASQPAFWVMCFSFGAVALAHSGLYTNFVPLLRDKGLSGAEAGMVAGVIGLSLIAGRLAAGFLFDKLWAPYVAAPLLMAPIIACSVLQLGDPGVAGAALAAVLLGLAAGVETDLIAYLAARYFGLRSYGAIYGILFGVFGLGSAVSPPLYGWIFDSYGSYAPALVAAGFLYALGALSLLALRQPEGRYAH